MKTKKIHFYSGVIMTVFIGIHLFNHLAIFAGTDYHIKLMNSLRVVYRNPVVESFLLLAVVVQIYSGIQLLRKWRKLDKTRWNKLHIYSGLYLAIFFLFHVFAVLAGRIILNLDTNLYFGIAGLNTFPFFLFFGPYYFLAILAFFAHIAAVHRMKMRKEIVGINPSKQSKIILFTGLVLSILLMAGLTDWFQGIEIPGSYDILVGK